MKTRKGTAEEKFWRMVEKTESCWLWLGCRQDNGYGQFRWEGRTTLAHHVSLVIDGVDVPSGMFTFNDCGNRHCVRPDHWIITTMSLGVMARHRHEKH